MVCCALFRGPVGFEISPGRPGLRSYRRRGIITKHTADSSDTKAALTSSLLVASRGWSRSLLTMLTQTTSHHSWEAEMSCSITRHETDFFQLQWTGHKPSLTTSSAQTEQREDGWAGTEDKRGAGAAQGTLNKVVIHFNLHLGEKIPKGTSLKIWLAQFQKAICSIQHVHLTLLKLFHRC